MLSKMCDVWLSQESALSNFLNDKFVQKSELQK